MCPDVPGPQSAEKCASVAQWQSSSFVMSRLGVRFPSLAPYDNGTLLRVPFVV